MEGQFKFNFKPGAISREDSKRFLDWAFWRDFERNGPSLYRLGQTMLQGWQRYKDYPGPRLREQERWNMRSEKLPWARATWL